MTFCCIIYEIVSLVICTSNILRNAVPLGAGIRLSLGMPGADSQSLQRFVKVALCNLGGGSCGILSNNNPY